MESEYIRVLESFALVSVIMPYYGYADEIFLVLSSLSVRIRQNLIDFYAEFRNFMLQYSKIKKITIEKLSEMKLPLDLFRFKLKMSLFTERAEDLIALINKLESKKGIYFDIHYMNQQICIDQIYVNAEYIVDLYPHIEALKSIKALSYKNDKFTQFSSILDFVVLTNIFSHCNKVLNICYFKDSECTEVDPIYQSFKRVRDINEGYHNVKVLQTKLNMLKQANISEIEILRFIELSTKELEQITNPDYFNYQVETIFFIGISLGSINDLILENVSKINHQQLYLPESLSISDAIRVISKISGDITLKPFQLDQSQFYGLRFKETSLLLKNYESVIKLYCKCIDFWYSDFKDCHITFIEDKVCITSYKKMECEDLRNEIFTSDLMLEDLSTITSHNDTYFCIPKNSLSYIRLKLRQVLTLLNNDSNKKHFSSIYSITPVIIELQSMDDLMEFDIVYELIPKHSEIIFNGKLYTYNLNNKVQFDDTTLEDKIFNLKLSSITISEMDEKESILKCILKTPSIQSSLKKLHLFSCNANECIEILSICIKCTQLEEIWIKCKRIDNSDTYIERFKEAEDLIRQSCKNINIFYVTF